MTYEDDKFYLLNIYKRYPLNVIKAKGMYIYAEFEGEKRKYLDMFSSLATNSLGHRNRKIVRAIKKQTNRYLHLSNYFASTASMKLAKILIDNSFASKVMFTNSGTEANEAALKLVRLHGKSTKKKEIITLTDSFPGRTYGSMSLTSQKDKNNKFSPLLDNIIHIEKNNMKELEKSVNKDTLAIFIELIQGEGGVHPLSAEYVNMLVTLREKYKFLIVLDEVQTGLLRTGLLFSYMHYKFTPDIMTLAKSLGGGLPLGAVLVSEELEDILLPGDHGTTFGGNPVSCSAGYAVLKELVKFNTYHHVNLIGNYLKEKLYILKQKYPPIIKDVRGRGLILGVEIIKNIDEIKAKLFDSNILINITNNNIIRLLPAFIIKKKEIDFFINELDRILSQIEEWIC